MSGASKKASSKSGSSRNSSRSAVRSSSRSSSRKKAAKAPLASREGAAGHAEEEPMSQVTLKMRQSQHLQLTRMAFDQGTTMRGLIMRALKAAGLKVTKKDLVDRRRR